MNVKTEYLQYNWQQFILNNDNGMIVKFLNFGGIITDILIPDQSGHIENVVLSYKNYQDYETDKHFLGAIIGPVAGRIEHARFSLNDKQYVVEKNDGNHHLHGGKNGFHQVVWHAEPFQRPDIVGVKLTHTRKEAAGGFPGELHVHVTYSLNNANQLIIDYGATTDKATYLTLTNHSYFNLSGNAKETILQHELILDSNTIAELNEDLIPTGKIIDTTNTPFDFRNKRKLQDGITSAAEQNKIVGNGYDHYFIFNHTKQEVVIVKDASNGRIMTIKTDQPGMVMYTANNLANGLALSSNLSKKYGGVCFETQASPASIQYNHFPSILLSPDDTYRKQTIFSFSTE